MHFFKLIAVLSTYNQSHSDFDVTPWFPGARAKGAPAYRLHEGGLARLMDQADREARLLSLTVRPF